MALNNTAMAVGGTAIKALLAYAQLHSASAGGSFTSNVTSAARQAITWAAITGPGSFSLTSAIAFTGGGANNPVYSVTLWSAITGGTCYGEFPLTGDTAFNAAGQYSVTALDFTGSAT